MNLVYFLGRFHVLVLHLPIALVLVTVTAEWLSRKPRYRTLEGALTFLWGCTAITAIVTVVLGYMHFAEGGFTGTSATLHRLFGTSIAVFSTVAWLLRFAASQRVALARHATSALLVVLVVLTGHYGGNLTHGNTYLVEYAPSPLRRLVGFQQARPPVTEINQADPYLDIVEPMLTQRCGSCHNNDKQRGGLNLASLESLMKGGDGGPVVVPGKPDESDLYRRITLAPDHNDFMPAEGKTPLTEAQVSIVRWWIESGLSTNTTLASLDAPAELQKALEAELNLSGEIVSHGNALSSASPAMISKLNEAGFIVRQNSMSDAALIVSAAAPGETLTEAQLTALAAAPADITELDVPRAQIADAALSVIRKLENLRHLRLENNQITDKGLSQLRSLSKLQYLNLYGNEGITDASIDTIASIKSLRVVYLWMTDVTPEGVRRLRDVRPDLQVNVGAEERSSRIAR